jgi:PTS system nitrogen regulatory IIA component
MIMLTDLFPPDRVLQFRAADQAAATTELVRRAATIAGIPPGPIGTAIAAREDLGSTGVGSGIAIPHARLEGLSQMVGLFARLERPVDWRAVDGKPVDLVFLLLSPNGADSEHLSALALVTRRLRSASVAAHLRATTSAPALRDALLDVAEQRHGAA